jgi:hypothetical protein
MSNTNQIESSLHENRSFAPPADFAATAQPDATALALLREQADRDPQGFWADQARGASTRRWSSRPRTARCAG